MLLDTAAKTICSHKSRFSCKHCSLRKLCLPLGLSQEEESHLDCLIEKQSIVAKGKTICEQGSEYSGLYVIKSGAFKAIYSDGERDIITAFYLPGEFFGVEAITDDTYPTSIVALQDSAVCTLSFDRLLELMRKIPSLQKHFIGLLSQNLKEVNYQILHHHTAEERLMIFLQRLSAHFEKRGFSAKEFNLPMSRKDMANYLDLANETISRLFAGLQQKGVLEIEGKRVSFV